MTIVSTVDVECEDDWDDDRCRGAAKAVSSQAAIEFIGKPRSVGLEPRVSEMIGIKEFMKEAYARLKRLHVNTFVFIYQDLIQALLKI